MKLSPNPAYSLQSADGDAKLFFPGVHLAWIAGFTTIRRDPRKFNSDGKALTFRRCLTSKFSVGVSFKQWTTQYMFHKQSIFRRVYKLVLKISPFLKFRLRLKLIPDHEL